MTDRELLEMAAKAAGLGNVWYLDGCDTPYVGKKYELGAPVEYRIFNPLTDDGEALRLAVKLRLEVCHVNSPHRVFAIHQLGPAAGCAELECGEDPYAATRRAIVRTAAEIGRQMGAKA